MRPLLLELEGFTVYRKPQRIDFEKLSFFIIQGKTGAGKTSIVDAITFALYGKVPRYRSARNTPSLVLSKGSKRMKVSLLFSVGGKRYKIERFYREKPREDIVRVEEEGRRLNLKKSEVEAWVEKVTGLDYKTFTKVILLPQGEFDRFLKPSTPKERREILINLLNLEVFEKVRSLASDSCRVLEGELRALRSELESIGSIGPEELKALEEERKSLEKESESLKESISELERRLRRAREKEEIEKEVAELEERLRELRDREEDIGEKKERLERARRLLPFLPYIERLEELKRELRDLRIERERVLKERVKLSDELANISSEIEKAEAEYRRLPQLREELQEAVGKKEKLSIAKKELRSLREFEKELKDIEKELEERERELSEREDRLRKGEEYIAEAERELRDLDFDEELYERLLKEVERKKSLLERKERLEEVERELKKLEEEEAKYREETQRLRRELEEKERELEKVSLLEQAHHLRAHLREGDTCPVCGGVFSGAPEEEVAQAGSLKEEVKEIQKRLLEEEKRLSSTEAKIESLKREREELSSLLKGWEDILKIDIESRLSRMEEKKKKKQELEKKLKKYGDRYNQLLRERESALRAVESLRSRKEAVERSADEKREKLRELMGFFFSEEEVEKQEKELSLLEKHLRDKIAEIEKRREEVREYAQKLERDLAGVEARLKEIESSIEKKEEERKANLRRLTPVMEEQGDLERVRELALTEEELRELEKEIEGYERELALTEEKLDALRKRLESYGDTPPSEEVERELSLIRERYEELMRRIGELSSELQQRRKLLTRKEEIERKLKEIERELSLYRRLSEDLKSDRLQDFAASLMLKRIVERASEYLYNFTGNYELDMDASGDLIVVDRVQGSERDVKSLSGGETFLASLSLALGVSDVLSARAHLESLFIDEGFGSLDEETRERVSDILEVIKQRINRMVGIISHIPDLAERFHQRIVVSKHGDFSTVEVLY